MLVGVELYERDPGVSVDNSLLINTAYTFDGAEVVSVLSHQIAGMLCFYFTSSLQLLFLALYGDNLRLSKNEALLGYSSFQGF
jgi:hypothetical protein